MYLKIENQFRIRKYMVIVIACIIIAVVASYRSFEKPGLWFTDEFGYFYSAAYMTGFNWTDLLNSIPYYGFGYGILLIPGFVLCNSANKLMVYAVVLNIIFLVASFLIALKLLIENEKCNFYLGCLASMFSVLYINNIVQIGIGWTEDLNVLLYWSALYFFYKITIDSKLINYIFFGMVICFSVMVHMRNICIAIAGVIVIIIYELLKRNKNKKTIFAFVLCVLIGILTFFIIKLIMKSVLWYNQKEQVNDVSTVAQQVFNVSSYIDITDFAGSISAKMFYIISATYGSVIIGGIYLVYTAKKNILHLYAALTLMLGFLIGVYFMVIPSRYDMIFYGRYFESYIGMALASFCVFMFENRHKYKVMVCLVMVYIYKVTYVIQQQYIINSLNNIEDNNIVFPCISGMAKYIFEYGKENAINEIFRNIIVVSLIVLLLGFVLNKKYIASICKICVCIMIIFLWIRDSYYIEDRMLQYEKERYAEVIDIAEYLDFEWNKQADDIYFIGNTNDYIWDLQFLLGKTRIIILNDIGEKENAFCIMKKEDYYEKIENNTGKYQILIENNQFVLLK